MPILNNKDTKGSYYQFGTTGKKYYYKTGNVKLRTLARAKAAKQGRAIEWSKHRKK
jgi:hypothetical protein